MLLNYFKLKNISCLRSQANRGKVIALSVVGGVFIFVVLLAIWHNNFADTLIAYTPDDTKVYIHFSRPKINRPEKIDQVLKNIFTDLGLVNYESLDINREVAVIGRLQNNQINYGLIIKTDRPTQLKKTLTAANLEFKILTYNRFLIAPANWTSDYQINKANFVKSTVAKRFYPLSSLNIYVAADFFAGSHDLILNMVHGLLKNENNDLIVSLKAKGSQLKMYNGGISSVVAKPISFKSENLAQPIDGDLVFSTTNVYTLINNWQDSFKNVSLADYQLLAESQLATYLKTYLASDNQNMLVVVKKNNNNSGWLVGDYDFYIALENIYTNKVEELLKTIMALRYPVTKSVYLSDGTRVVELIPDISSFSFVDKNGFRYLSSPDGHFNFIYKPDGQNVVISNSEFLINQNWSKSRTNYLKFSSALLADNGLSRYLKLFTALEISKSGLILK